ncbi:DUF6894 family protein [Leptospira interrogans]
MARHYFHLANGTTTLDPTGLDLADLGAVRNEAVRAVRELLNLGKTDELWSGAPWKVWVTDGPDGTGRTILTVELTTG